MTFTPTLPAFDTLRSDRFEAFAAGFRSVFHRADQFLRFRAYLRGLLEPGGRKNVEGIAAAAAAHIMVEQDLPQALQHFVTTSPWDSRRLIDAVRRQSAPARQEAVALYIVHENACEKKGRHSVGVQRQYARHRGEKINCQIGIFVSQVVGESFFPLAVRLYLPANWLRDNAELAERLVPAEERESLLKGAVARRLLADLLENGEPVKRLANDGRQRDLADLADWLAEQGVTVEDHAVDSHLATFHTTMTALGLDHYEGRSWVGWHHHAALVITAYAFLAQE